MKGKKQILLFGLCWCWSVAALAALENLEPEPRPLPYTAEEIQAQWQGMNTPIDWKIDQVLQKRIKGLVTRGRKGMERFLGRGTIFFPIFELVLKEKGLPQELKYLPVIETGLHPKAKSHRGAVGLWQLMPGTARDYGLLIDEQIDERLDINKSTEAACQFLVDLYTEFEDWALAIAAYNCGPGRMKKAISRAQSRRYSDLKRYLPRETRTYLEKFVAITYLMNHYHFYDLRPRYPDYTLQMTQTLRIYSRKTFAQVARESGISVDVISYLNPAYYRGVIPRRQEGNLLILPRLGVANDYGLEGMQALRN